MNKVKTFLIISRPLYWPIYIFIYIAGTISINSFTSIYALGLMFVTFPLGLIICGLNDISDRESDAQNSRKGGLEGHILKVNEIKSVIFAVMLISAAFIFTMLVLRFYYAAILVFLIALFSYLYSFRPFRFKSRPILDSLTLGVGLLLIYLFGKSLIINSFSNLIKIPQVIWLLILGAVILHSITTLWDVEIDKKLGDQTTGVFLGKRGTLGFASLILVFILFTAQSFPLSIQFYLLFSILITLAMLIKPNNKFIHIGTWLIIGGFIIMCLYLLIFDISFIQQALKV